MGDIFRFKDGELLARMAKWLHEIPMFSLLVRQQREIKSVGLKRTGQ